MADLIIRDLSYTYPASDQKALSGVNLTLRAGELMTIVGPTGSGKSTLLRLLKPELHRNGALCGSITLGGDDVSALTPEQSARRIGYVGQYPEEQIVTDKVWHELAFTLENLGASQALIARRIAEVAACFGIESWFRRPTAELSGGQKQLLSLAAVMTADPELLILDEPTSQLDPISAERFLDVVRRLNRETGLSVIITEHRAEALIPVSDRLVILDGGKVVFDDAPQHITARLVPDHPYLRYLPCAAQVFAMTGGAGDCPLSVSDGRRYLERTFENKITSLDGDDPEQNAEVALELKNICFRYDKSAPDVLRDLNLTVHCGEVFALLGANGAGKSTAVGVIAGLRRPCAGKVRLFDRPLKDYRSGSLYEGCVSLLPQDTESVFLCPTVREELKGCDNAIRRLPFDFTPLFDRHPYDLSGGERQLVALCRVLATKPRLLLLDEPSKGLDPDAKIRLAALLRLLSNEGVTVLIVSHDVAFASRCADRCALLFDGAVAACDSTARFLSGNRFYTTPASRMTRGIYNDAYTAERTAELALKNGRRA